MDFKLNTNQEIAPILEAGDLVLVDWESGRNQLYLTAYVEDEGEESYTLLDINNGTTSATGYYHEVHELIQSLEDSNFVLGYQIFSKYGYEITIQQKGRV